MKSFLRNMSAFKLQTWFLPGPQKSASGIQAIPHDNRIYVGYFGLSGGYYRTDLYYKWWTGVDAMIKIWDKRDIEEYMRQAYDFAEPPADFWGWWDTLRPNMQNVYIQGFIHAHEPMIRKELDEHYAKNSVQT